MASQIRQVAVIGTGVIGASWAMQFASKGLRVICSDPAPGAYEQLKKYVSSSLQRLGRHDEAESVLERISFPSDLRSKLGEVDFVQENGPERLDYKTSCFRLLAETTGPDTVLASSSSGLPSSAFIQDCPRPSDVLIGHPFNPPHLIPLVEVVPHSGTSATAVESALAFYKEMDKKPILVSQETPGFVGNRLQAALVHEAYSLVSRGIVSAEDVDAIVSNGIALRWAVQGPFLTKVLGGGGNGVEGFRRHLAHVGKAAGPWLDDMRKHNFEPTAPAQDALIESVERQLAKMDAASLETVRDRFVSAAVKLKAEL